MDGFQAVGSPLLAAGGAPTSPTPTRPPASTPTPPGSKRAVRLLGALDGPVVTPDCGRRAEEPLLLALGHGLSPAANMRRPDVSTAAVRSSHHLGHGGDEGVAHEA